MKVIALNSSLRKDRNTAMVLKKAPEGAASAGILHDLEFYTKRDRIRTG